SCVPSPERDKALLPGCFPGEGAVKMSPMLDRFPEMLAS
ncbi:MAG: hypothetical protein ACI9ON_001360, partial [Limisphaerales bacterium]